VTIAQGVNHPISPEPSATKNAAISTATPASKFTCARFIAILGEEHHWKAVPGQADQRLATIDRTEHRR